MLFESTKTLLRAIVQTLEKEADASWDELLQSGIQTLYELHQMSRASGRTYKTETGANRLPVSERAARAIPYVKLMTSAVRRRDQASAHESGKAAIVEMDGLTPARVAAPVAPAPPVAPQIETPVEVKPRKKADAARHRKPVTNKRLTVAKRKPVRSAARAARSSARRRAKPAVRTASAGR